MRDRGIGIRSEDAEHIFEKFYRGGNASQVGVKGVGIGLAIVREIVKAHGGRVRLESAPADGTVFTIVLPVQEKAMSRILIVEDEPAILFGLEADLKKEGYQVEVAEDGETGLACAKEGGFDLIVLDIMLPKKDGFEVCRELRLAGDRTPILLLTARSGEAEKVMGLDLGADDYVTKPFSPKELRARIRAHLRRGAQDLDETYSFGDAEVDVLRGEVRRGGRAVETTPLEFRLLCTLVKNRGRVLSRDRLIDLVWGIGMSVSDRVVDNYIVTLRKKLEPDPAAPRYFVSVRGQGYRFDG